MFAASVVEKSEPKKVTGVMSRLRKVDTDAVVSDS